MQARRLWRWIPAALLVLGGAMAPAGDLEIQTFDGTGQLSFNEVSTALVYRVEWAPSPSGPWTNSWREIERVAAYGTGSVTCSVPMCYRVVAVVPTNLYLVVDLSGGASASNYPVSYLPAIPPGGWTDEHKTSKLVMRLLPATTPDFTMGNLPGEWGSYTNETPHQVTLTKNFYLGVFEVTQRQWELVMGDKPSYFTNTTYYAIRPVDSVSYCYIRENPLTIDDDPAVDWPANSAVNTNSFMGKLRARTGLEGFDLPTEAQWEYACRAGKRTGLNSGYNLTGTSPDARLDEVGRYWYNGGSAYSPNCAKNAGTAPVGSYLPNAWGLYDMHGNVWEWCLDWYGTYPGTITDPPGASEGAERVKRGGSFGSMAYECRSAWRGTHWPPDGGLINGFRACYTPPTP